MDPAEHPSPVPVSARPFQGHRAGVVTRFAAGGADLLVVIAIVAFLYGLIAAFSFLLRPSTFSWPDNTGWSVPVVGFVVVVPYLTLTWCTTGRSYGAALLGLRVVDSSGHRLRVAQSSLRAVVCVLFPIGLLWVAISSSNRSVQDVLLRTSVIYDWTPRTKDIP